MYSRMLDFWGQHCLLDASHAEWLRHHVRPLAVKRRHLLFHPHSAAPQRSLYFVLEGLLASVSRDREGNRGIRRIVLPDDSILTTHHLYTQRHLDYEIVALRPSVLLELPSDAFRAYKEVCWEADVLSDVLEYKKLQQYRAKARLMLAPSHIERYVAFYYELAPIRRATTQREQAEYLGISKMSITRALETLRAQR